MPRKRVESVYSMKSKNKFNKYAQLGALGFVAFYFGLLYVLVSVKD